MTTLHIRGELLLSKYDKHGNMVWQEVRHNLITSAGKAAVAKLAGGIVQSQAFSYLATGTGTTAPALENTALEHENTAYGSERKQGTVSCATTTLADDTLKIETTWDFTGAINITEIGVFDQPSGGTLLARQVSTARSFTAGESLRLVYKIIFS